MRIWWVCGAALLIAGGYLGLAGVLRWRHEQWLLSLPPTVAMVEWSDAETVPHRPVKPGQTMQLSYEVRGAKVSAAVRQSGFKGEPMIGEPISIHVSPDDPSDLTIRNEAIALGTVLAGGLAMICLSIIAIGVSVIRRRSVLRTWRLGEVRQAGVLARQQTALAPRSRALRCAWADDDQDRRIFQVFVPANAPEADPAVDGVELLYRKGASPLALAWFE